MIRAALVAFGLVFCAVPQAAHAVEWGLCTDYSYLNHFDARLHAEDCDEITTVDINWNGRTVQMRAIHPRSMTMDDSAHIRARIQDVADRVGAAMTTMGGDRLDLDNITVLFTDLHSRPEGGRDEDYDAGTRPAFGEECPITFYGSYATIDDTDFAFTLAHEIYHCIQFATWPGMLDEPWVYEGTAEYFGYLAVPNYGTEPIAEFDAFIPGRPFGDMVYEGVVFYMWLGDARGPTAVRDFTGSARSLESAVDSDMWIEFAQRYFDQTIRMPDGRPLPSHPQVGGTHEINGDDHIDMPDMTPYTLNNAILAFAREHIYTLTHAPAPADVRVMWKHADHWVTPPASVTTCDGDQRYRVIWASTRSTTNGDTEVRAAPASAGACTCPVGIWHETEDSLRHMMEQSATGGQIEFISGSRVLQLNPDGTGLFFYVDVVTDTLPRAGFWVRQTKRGGSHFTWHAREGRLLTVLLPGDNLLQLENEMHSPSGTRVENRRAGVQSIGHDFYCNEAGLHLRQSAPSPLGARFTVDMDFVRAGGAER